MHLERKAARRLARKVEQLQAGESRIAVLEAQLAESRAQAAEAEQASARVAELCAELRQQKAMLEVELDGAKGAITLKERLAKLDEPVAHFERRPNVERTFNQIARTLFKRLPSTTGSNPQTGRADEAERKAVERSRKRNSP